MFFNPFQRKETSQKMTVIYDEPLSKKPDSLKEVKESVENLKASAQKKKTQNKEAEGIHSVSTLFVSTIPYEASKDDVENFFSEIGPIRSCFLIMKNGKNSGCGFVQFALPDDAKRALVELKKKKFQDKRILKLSYAIKKTIVEDRKKGIKCKYFNVFSWNSTRCGRKRKRKKG
jgi:RNA recognition motif-containing protein